MASITCTRCHEPKPADEFYTTHGRPRRICKTCSIFAIRARKRARDEEWGNPRTAVGVYCPVCYGLAHRVVGPVCRSCGLERREEPAQVLGDPWRSHDYWEEM